MSAPARPPWAPPGLQTTKLTAWPQEVDGEADKLVRIFAFEGVVISRKTTERLGDWLGLEMEAKYCWARVDVASDTVWVRFDHIAADHKDTCVFRESQWMTLATFLNSFPRAQMPYRSAIGIFYNQGCTRVNPNKGMDDHEVQYMRSDDGDKLEDDDLLNPEQQSRVIDEAGVKGWWQKEFGG